MKYLARSVVPLSDFRIQIRAEILTPTLCSKRSFQVYIDIFVTRAHEIPDNLARRSPALLLRPPAPRLSLSRPLHLKGYPLLTPQDEGKVSQQ